VYADDLFATAGHAVGQPDSFVGQPGEADMMGQVVENFLANGADIALVRVLVGVNATEDTVWVDVNSTQAVTFANQERPEEGELLWLQGAQSGLVECSVYLTDADIVEPNSGEHVNNVVLLNLGVQTQPGDSGAPVTGQGTNLCYGIYGGRVVVEGVTYGWLTPFENLEWD